jgi:hypothetical protein
MVDTWSAFMPPSSIWPMALPSISSSCRQHGDTKRLAARFPIANNPTNKQATLLLASRPGRLLAWVEERRLVHLEEGVDVDTDHDAKNDEAQHDEAAVRAVWVG